MKLRIGVIFGGESVEHEVSIISAVQAMRSLNKDKYEIVPIYIAKDGEWYTGKSLKNIKEYNNLESVKKRAVNVILSNKGNNFVLIKKQGIRKIVDSIDLALPIVHGTNVEDGTLQGFLETIGIPYAGSNLYSAAVGQDKVFQKQILEASKLPVTKYAWFFASDYINNEKDVIKNIEAIGYPVMVKPARLGSSVGISKAKNEAEAKEAIEEAIKYDEKIIVEKVIENLIEVNCSVLGDHEKQEASELEEVLSADEFLSYRDKYLGGSKKTSSKGMASTNRILPARLNNKTAEQVKELSKETFRVLNASGVIRIDFLIDKKSKKVYINETNTIPGSLSFYLWEATGKPYEQLLDEIIKLAIKAHKEKNRRVFSFETNILSNFNGLKGSKGKLVK